MLPYQRGGNEPLTPPPAHFHSVTTGSVAAKGEGAQVIIVTKSPVAGKSTKGQKSQWKSPLALSPANASLTHRPFPSLLKAFPRVIVVGGGR